jgi:hypothetical protein
MFSRLDPSIPNDIALLEAAIYVDLARKSDWRATTQRPHNPPFPRLVRAILSSYTNSTGPQCSPRRRIGQETKVLLKLTYGLSQAAQHVRRTNCWHIAIKDTFREAGCIIRR